MCIEIVLPYSLSSLIEDKEVKKNSKIIVNASSLNEIHNIFVEKYYELSKNIWDGESNIKTNIILILNDKIINKNDLDKLKIPDNSVLELMFQFAGG